MDIQKLMDISHNLWNQEVLYKMYHLIIEKFQIQILIKKIIYFLRRITNKHNNKNNNKQIKVYTLIFNLILIIKYIKKDHQ